MSRVLEKIDAVPNGRAILAEILIQSRGRSEWIPEHILPALEEATGVYIREHPGHADQKVHGRKKGGGGEGLEKTKRALGEMDQQPRMAGYVSGPAPGAGSREATLALAEDQICTLAHERAYAVADDGRLLGGVEGHESTVEIGKLKNPGGVDLKGATITHNHPYETPPSGDDMGVAIQNGLREIRAVTPTTVETIRPLVSGADEAKAVRAITHEVGQRALDELASRGITNRQEYVTERAKLLREALVNEIRNGRLKGKVEYSMESR